MKKFLIPLVIFLVLVGFLAVGLGLNPREVPSPLINKPAPAFSLPLLDAPEQQLAAQDLRGKVWILNVWASWCVACRIEHPLLVEFSKMGVVPLYGLNYKDKRDDAIGWLKKFGNPYTRSISDLDGLVGIDFGVYGVPETFVIDKQGVIRFKQIGPVTPEVLRDDIIPLVRNSVLERLCLHLTRVLVCAVAALALAAGAKEAAPASDDPALEARVMVIAEELRCLVCQNETIAASHADLAVDLRKQIRIKLQAGQSQQQILDFMVARYGDFVLYRPPLKASTVLLWIGPFVLLLVAGAVLAVNIRRRRRGEKTEEWSEAQAHRARALLDDGPGNS